VTVHQANGHTRRQRAKPQAAEAIEDMGVERDLGRLDGAVKALEDRADRNETATQGRFQSLELKLEAQSINIAREFKEQNTKLDTLILRTAKEDGAQESESSAQESRLSFWTKWSGFAIVVGTVVAVLQPSFDWLKHVIMGH
jgi:hypothetical protein